VRIVGLDSHILVWGIKGEAAPGQERMVSRAQAFLRSLDDEKDTKVYVPAIVLGEILVRVPEADHQRVMAVVSKSLMIAPYDAAAASEFARLLAKALAASKNAGNLQQGAPGVRTKMKADLMILATALSRNVSCLYSHDPEMPKLATYASGRLKVAEMPDTPEQLPLLQPSPPPRRP
jgi:predicted nucleic acid-binding protein